MTNDLEQRVNEVLKIAEDSKGQFSGEMTHNWSDYELDIIIDLLREQQALIKDHEKRVKRLYEFEQRAKPINPSMDGDDHKLGIWRGLAEALAIMTTEFKK